MKTIFAQGWMPRNCFTSKDMWDDREPHALVVYPTPPTPEEGCGPYMKVNVMLEMTEVCFDEEPDEGDLIPLDEWLEACDGYGFIDDDGWGHPVKDGKQCSHVTISPSERSYAIPEGTTHIMWYNK